MKDVTRSVLTESEIRNIISRIFPDGLILVKPYTIVSVGRDISNILGIPENQLSGMPLSSFTGPEFSEGTLKDLLRSGYFEGYELSLNCRAGVSIPCVLSGFYFGLIADINDLVILKFKFRSNLETILRQLQAKTEELDDFIYAAAHDLRGPLATLKGLINLMKMPGRKDYKFIYEKMGYFADRLDDRLHKLIYFAESDKDCDVSAQLTLSEIVESLSLSGGGYYRVSSLFLKSDLPQPSPMFKHGKLILALLANVKSFFVHNCSRQPEIDLHVTLRDTSCEFSMSIDSIDITADQQRRFDTPGFGYAEILSDPQFTDIYSAKKIALKLQGNLRLQMTGEKVLIHVSIPRI